MVSCIFREHGYLFCAFSRFLLYAPPPPPPHPPIPIAIPTPASDWFVSEPRKTLAIHEKLDVLAPYGN